MNNKYHYTLKLKWIGDKAVSSIKNDRLYEIAIPGKPSFKGSADHVFHGDPAWVNPEDLLLSALSSCHMMSYFYVCRNKNIEIISYQDEPIGELEVNVDGSGRFCKVVLKPKVVVKHKIDVEQANSLHNKAGELCFIANSCNFRIEIQPEIIVSN